MDAVRAVHFVAEKVLARGAMVGLAAEQAAQKAYWRQAVLRALVLVPRPALPEAARQQVWQRAPVRQRRAYAPVLELRAAAQPVAARLVQLA